MDTRDVALAFGPIPSRRLGRSLGVNHIPPKHCSYACRYCQVGRTTVRTAEPCDFTPPERVAAAVAEHVAAVRARGERIDHLTFAPDGEPTLDAGLGETIRLLRPLRIPIAVFTNGSLLWRPDVRAALAGADWVSVKVDAVLDDVWRAVDRPDPHLELPTVLEGIECFAAGFRGQLVSETMLVRDVNDGERSVDAVGRFLARVRPAIAYLAVPTRPAPDPSVVPPDEAVVVRAHGILRRSLPRVELLVGDEGLGFSASGDPRDDLLGITAVQPMRRAAVDDLLRRSGAGWEVVDDLLAEGLLARVEHQGEEFYVRRFGPRRTEVRRG